VIVPARQGSGAISFANSSVPAPLGLSAGEAFDRRRVRGVGDEAFWNGSSLGGGLFVLKGDVYVRLSVGGPEPEAVEIGS
jgi:hypothetical protein